MTPTPDLAAMAAEILDLAQNATPAPWTTLGGYQDTGLDGDDVEYTTVIYTGDDGAWGVIFEPPEIEDEEVEQAEADAKFAAHARTSAPALARAYLDEHAARLAAEQAIAFGRAVEQQQRETFAAQVARIATLEAALRGAAEESGLIQSAKARGFGIDYASGVVISIKRAIDAVLGEEAPK